ncbi:formimidoylglutamase [Alteromonas pelagimontana]|uniref:Formimidoylglutamase n=1 Tax=Alteromonas pelagimontana TaxID=1858656 RepID=A0A6M4MHP0_9ALTE|nr:formimidoylglutamase [Alteromonas pelagimontana]QJR82532.1 formimidoylglutamase [Alteromonas pelagimontana]
MENLNPWTGRIDAEDGERGHRWHQVVQCQHIDELPEHEKALVLVGYPNDSGVAANKGRTGAAEGPNALRHALANLPWCKEGSLYDVGDSTIFDVLDDTQCSYASLVSCALKKKAKVIGLGGGHDIAWAAFQGLAAALPQGTNIGIINIDAHLDLRKPSPAGTSGTPFRQISEWCHQQKMPFHYACFGVSKAANTSALFDYAKESNTRLLLDYEFNIESAIATVTPFLESIDSLYVTVCMDAFSSSVAPGVSAPAALGIPPIAVIQFLQWLGKQQSPLSFRWHYSDIAELNPTYDAEMKTARLAARLVFELTDAMG